MIRLCRDTPLIHPECSISASRFGAYVEIGRASIIAHSDFGDYAYCDRLSDIANTTVGKFANIAAMTRIGPTDHPMGGASLHHFHYRASRYWDDAADDADFFARRQARRTVLGADCWVGHGAIIRPDVTVGIGSVVAAGAVVTKDVAPYMIVAGVPAVPLRERFSRDLTERLLALAWWDWPHDRLRAALDDFRGLAAEAFVEAYSG
ncbi:MAG: chloramphenicol acetyltransferase [Paracoccaceae bacterium]|nr:chloramphenicol acetyltransferase [Paracoccaceae bacterium]